MPICFSCASIFLATAALLSKFSDKFEDDDDCDSELSLSEGTNSFFLDYSGNMNEKDSIYHLFHIQTRHNISVLSNILLNSVLHQNYGLLYFYFCVTLYIMIDKEFSHVEISMFFLYDHFIIINCCLKSYSSEKLS